MCAWYFLWLVSQPTSFHHVTMIQSSPCPLPTGFQTMRVFLEIALRSFRRQMTYRAAALAGLATNFFFGLLRAAVLVALYGEHSEVAGISLQSAVTFTGLSQAAIAPLSMFHWYDVMRSVYSGEVASDLLKPMSYFRFWLVQDFGRAAASFIWRSLTIMAGYAVMFDLTYPHNIEQWAVLGLAMLLSWLVSFSWRFLINLAAFWTPNAIGLNRLFFILSWFLSGFLMPLRYFPDWFVRLCYLTPFPHMVNSLVEIYLGVLTGHEVFQTLLLQAVWAVCLTLCSQLVLRLGVRRLVILGG
ncbi:MAG: ABC-2 family transporter protein [Chloroflexota bacterium]